jgi:hypothetical protein
MQNYIPSETIADVNTWEYAFDNPPLLSTDL